jgi:hypothetical protein
VEKERRSVSAGEWGGAGGRGRTLFFAVEKTEELVQQQTLHRREAVVEALLGRLKACSPISLLVSIVERGGEEEEDAPRTKNTLFSTNISLLKLCPSGT